MRDLPYVKCFRPISTEEGNLITTIDQRRKLDLVVEVVEAILGHRLENASHGSRAAAPLIALTMASRPSVSAAGPGCSMSGDLISKIRPSRTAGIDAQPGLA
ncbi:MAG: hypothetical protein KAH44_05465, partial [Oricola sp.]|nr:hypothetical protein [Oricola sp.]